MKKICLLLTFIPLIFFCQQVKIINDTIFVLPENKPIGIVFINFDNSKEVYFSTTKNYVSSNFKNQLYDTLGEYESRYLTSIFKVKLAFKNGNIFDLTDYPFYGMKVGSYVTIKNKKIKSIKITKYFAQISNNDFEYWAKASLFKNEEFNCKISTDYIIGNQIHYNFKKKLKKQYKNEQETIKIDSIAAEKQRKIDFIAAEKQRIQRFYAQVYDKLGGDLDPIEGIYKSVDMGEVFDYDIAILKSYENNREYVGLILKTTDTDLSIGDKILTFEKTAQKNLFFGKYITKDGKSFENKTASLNGAILKMGVKSFIKMFPAEGETRQYREINPMVDWQSSGSGVLINNNGFIATNNHVIKGAKKIRISFQNDSTDYEANIISQNEENDVAIIQITDSSFKSAVKPVKWNPSFSLGEKVFTLGYPISNKMSDNVKVVDGIVSGLNGREGNKSFFQTTLPVWYGNSGGPCFNSKGEILGLATQILRDKGEKVDNVAYITKTSNVLSLANSIITKENISSAGLNEVELQNLIKKLIPYSAFIKVNY